MTGLKKHMFSIVRGCVPLCILTSNQHIPWCVLLSRAFVVVSVLDLGHCNGCCVALVLINSSLMADDMRHLGMSPRAICRVSSMRWPLGSLAHFWIVLFVFLLFCLANWLYDLYPLQRPFLSCVLSCLEEWGVGTMKKKNLIYLKQYSKLYDIEWISYY